jgi:hypothetical protein
MITVYVDNDEEVEIIRENLVRSSACPFIHCDSKYNDYIACMKDNGDKFIKIIKREIVEVPVPLVV